LSKVLIIYYNISNFLIILSGLSYRYWCYNNSIICI